MLKLAIGVTFIAVVYLVFNGGVNVTVNGEKYDFKVEQSVVK